MFLRNINFHFAMAVTLPTQDSGFFSYPQKAGVGGKGVGARNYTKGMVRVKAPKKLIS